MKITKKLEKEILAVMDDYWGSYLKDAIQICFNLWDDFNLWTTILVSGSLQVPPKLYFEKH